MAARDIRRSSRTGYSWGVKKVNKKYKHSLPSLQTIKPR